ncbi:MAG: hypothetical protein SV253_07500 [Halobacteria archaeon]|nr:hypothetical protein [Halobacteria archaeon]
MSKRRKQSFSDSDTGLDKYPEFYDEDIQYILDINDSGLLLNEITESVFKDYPVQVPRDEIGWSQLPVEGVCFEVVGIGFRGESEDKKSVILKIDSVDEDCETSASETERRLELNDDGVVLKEVREYVFRDGTNEIEFERLGWDDLPVDGVSLTVVGIEMADGRGEDRNIRFDVV